MKLGFLTAPFPATPLMEVADWAAASRASRSWRSPAGRGAAGPTRRYAGTSHIDVANLSAAQATEIVDELATKGLVDLRPGLLPEPAPSGPGAPRAGHRPPEARHHRRREDGRAARQHVHGRRRGEDPGPELGGGAPRLAGHRARSPTTTGGRSRSRTAPCSSATTSGRAGTTSPPRPRMWRRILEQWGGTIGLNFDPSHLVLQMIDTRRFLKEFGAHVLHFQAKDLMIDRRRALRARRLLDGHGLADPAHPGARRGGLDRRVHRAVPRRASRATASSSTRTGASKGPTRRSSRASSSPATSCGRTASSARAQEHP